jgi:hypothetical protein
LILISRSLLEAGGVDRLMAVTRQRNRFTSRVVKFAGQVLFSMWQHQVTIKTETNFSFY